jgi:hypothetical protein
MKHTVARAILVVPLLFCSLPVFAQEPWAMPHAALARKISATPNPTQVALSEFAWQLFARVNQPAQLNGQTFREWELWKSDIDTFSPSANPTAPKFRTRPHLQKSVLAQNIGLRLHELQMKASGAQSTNPFDFEPSLEEVTRNDLSYTYIMGNGLNTQAGIAAFLASPQAQILFPFGAIETKAHWDKAALPGAYQITDPTTGTVYSLTGLHVMMKITSGSYNPFTSPQPSWFWATFEFKNNLDLAAAQKLITDGDSSPSGYAANVLQKAGLGSTPLVNYLCNGAQISFVDTSGKNMVLGNTQIEWFLATPQPQSLPTSDPAKWKSWSSSCHSCHAQASGQVSGSKINFFACTAPVGPLTGPALPGAQYRPFDFVWALFNAQ